MNKILVVEDEPALRECLRYVLRGEGYEVDSASWAGEAAAMALSPSVGLVVCDLHLPGIGGLELLASLRAARPGLPVLFISGYCTEERRREVREQGGFDLVPKPFLMEELMSAVNGALAAAPLSTASLGLA